MYLLLKKHKTNVIFWFKKNLNNKEITDEIFLQELENKSLEISSLNKFSKFLAKTNNEKSYLFYYKKGLEGNSGQAYIWRCENDGKTRPEHAAKEGQTFIWDEDENPGDSHGCRCRAEFLDGTLGRAKYDEDGNKFTQELKDKDGGVDLMAENIEKLKQDMKDNPKKYGNKNPLYGNGQCASYVASGLEAAGFKFKRTNSAKNYGVPFEKAGFENIAEGGGGSFPEKYSPRKGDVAVFDSYDPINKPHGHIAIFNGNNWASDFDQLNSMDSEKVGIGFWANNSYRTEQPSFVIYRSNDW